MNKKFSIIVADPSWKMGDGLKMSATKRGAESNYPVMSTEDICKLPVQDIADPNGCVLALWVLGSMLQEGLDVMKAWGFDQKQTYVWVKTKKHPFDGMEKSILKSAKEMINAGSVDSLIGNIKQLHRNVVDKFSLGDILSFYMGRLFRQTHEICLIGINNTKIYKHLQNKSQRSVSFKDNVGHSVKPSALQDSLDLMFPSKELNRVELFARRPRDGWVSIGNAINGKNILDELIELKNG